MRYNFGEVNKFNTYRLNQVFLYILGCLNIGTSRYEIKFYDSTFIIVSLFIGWYLIGNQKNFYFVLRTNPNTNQNTDCTAKYYNLM